MERITIQKTTGRIPLLLEAIPMGDDLCVLITGGELPHLGAVTVGSGERAPETVRFESHEEQYVTEAAAQIIRQRYGGNFAVLSGIHVDKITKAEIAAVLETAEEMVYELTERL